MHIAPIGGATAAGVSEAKLTPNTGQTGAVAGAGGPSPSSSIQPVLAADSAVIREVAVADLLKLTQILQPPSPPEIVARVEALIQATVTAINEGRREWAVGRFIEAVTTDPSRAEELRSNPDIQPIRNTVDQLFVRLTNVAKMDAETKLVAAERVIEDAGWPKLPHWETTPQALLQIGHRLLEAGGYANYVKTAELATTLQSAFWGATVAPADADRRSRAVEERRHAYRRPGRGFGNAGARLLLLGETAREITGSFGSPLAARPLAGFAGRVVRPRSGRGLFSRCGQSHLARFLDRAPRAILGFKSGVWGFWRWWGSASGRRFASLGVKVWLLLFAERRDRAVKSYEFLDPRCRECKAPTPPLKRPLMA